MGATDNRNYLLARAVAAGITDPRELANFMAQMQVESTGFTRLRESLHYSPKRLLKVFPGRNGLDSLAKAEALAAQGPEAIAEAVYGGDWGEKALGNNQPGDGWRYRGGGFAQLTGRDEYAIAARHTGLDLLHHPELVENREVAATVALDVWRRKVVDKGHQRDVAAAGKAINGGSNGAHERRVAASEWEAMFTRQSAVEMLAEAGIRVEPSRTAQGAGVMSPAGGTPATLRTGAHGPEVRDLQSRLDQLGYRDGDGQRLQADGSFGSRTATAVIAFQRAHGLPADGMFGPLTRGELDTAAMSGPTPVDPAHPDHALHRQLARAVGGMDLALGRAPDAASAQLAAALLVGVRAAGLTRVDHVVLSAGTPSRAAGLNVFAVQGALEDPASRRVRMSTTEALAAPVDHWQARLAALAPSQQERGARAAEERLEHHEGMRRIPQP